MFISRALVAASLSFALLSCATSTKTIKRVEEQLRVLESGGRLVPERVDRLCREGATAACALLGQTVELKQPLATVQGYTDVSSTLIALTAPSDVQLLYAVAKKGESPAAIIGVLRADRIYSRGFSEWRVEHLKIAGLKPGVPYELWAIGQDGTLWDRREFEALDTSKASPRVVVASCLDDGFRQEETLAWEKVRGTNPDVLFLIGDNVYADKYLSLEAKSTGADPEVLWNRYVETRNLLALFRWSRLVPVFAVWDDHDYGKNDGDSGYPYKAASRDVFEAFFPRPEKSSIFERGPGASSRFMAFGQQFIFFDNRTFRTSNRLDTGAQTHFGIEQEDWAMAAAAREKAPIWLISGGQFFGGYHNFESFEGNHAANFANFKTRLRGLKQPFVFVSGDRHLIELMKISKKDVGIDTYELTTSALHARTFAQNMERNPNPRRIFGASGPLNFMEVVPLASAKQLRLKVKGWGIAEGLLFEQELRVQRRK